MWIMGADGAIADWYNQPAQSGEWGTPLSVWNPALTIDKINSAVAWTQKPAGADIATQTLNCLIWQNMIWNNHIDMTDTQVRQGIADIWGTGTTNDTNLRSAGRRSPTRYEMVFAGAGIGGARITPVFGQICSADDITAARSLGG